MNIQEFIAHCPEIAAILQEIGREPKDVQSIGFSHSTPDCCIVETGIKRIPSGGARTLTLSFYDGDKHFVNLLKRPISWVEPEKEEEQTDEH